VSSRVPPETLERFLPGAGDRGAQAVGVARLVMAAGPIAPSMPPGMFETATAQRWLNVSRPALPW